MKVNISNIIVSINRNQEKEIYKELEKIVNIHRKGGKIFSNGYYIEDEEGRYPEYGGHYSNIIDIFAEYEVCDILGVNDNIIVYLDETKEIVKMILNNENIENIDSIEKMQSYG